jgi:transcriptional regulator with XRE-family HTH domain
MERRASPFTAEFGRRVRRRRRILDLTQAEVARRIQMGPGQYSRLESGEYRKVQVEQLARLADVLHTSLDYLLLRTEEDPGVIPPRYSPGEAQCLVGVTLPLVTTPPDGERSYGDCIK